MKGFTAVHFYQALSPAAHMHTQWQGWRHWLSLLVHALRREYHMLSAMATNPLHQRAGAFICRRAPVFTRAL